MKNSKGIISLNGGPQPAGLDATFKEMTYSQQHNDVIIEALYEGGIQKITWTMRGDGLLKFNMDYMARRSRRSYLHTGINFSYPEEKITGMRWMGNGPFRVWKNRMKGNSLHVWHKAYNNTITGESFDNLIYPEFKGNLLVGSLKFQYLDLCVLDGDKVVREKKFIEGLGRVRSIEQGPDGYIYVGVENVGIVKIIPKK